MLLVSVLVIAFASGDEESFQTVVHTMFHEAAILIVPIFLPMFAFLHILERRFTRPIEVLALDQQTFIERMESDVEQGRRDMRIAVDERGTKPRYEIAELYESTNKMRRDMVGFIERLYSVTAERQRTATELDVARQIQMSAVPHDFDSLTERFALDIAGFMRPAREVGGDFYDVFEVGERGVAFVIGDVSGKGVPAALFMMRAQSLLRQYLLETDDLGTAFTLANLSCVSATTPCCSLPRSHAWWTRQPARCASPTPATTRRCSSKTASSAILRVARGWCPALWTW